jgi:Molybdopterin oxidoreductase
VLDLVGREDFPVNRGGLCRKGATAAELIHHPERLTTPLARDRRSRPLSPVSWDDALDRVAAAVRKAQAEHGPDAVGCFGGGGLTNEKAYQLGKFARVALGSAMVDYNGRFCMSSAAAAANRAFGIDRGLPFPLTDVADADVVLLVGSNPADTMPPAMQWFERGARHIVVDPRRTATAQLAHRHLQPLPGTDLATGLGARCAPRRPAARTQAARSRTASSTPPRWSARSTCVPSRSRTARALRANGWPSTRPYRGRRSRGRPLTASVRSHHGESPFLVRRVSISRTSWCFPATRSIGGRSQVGMTTGPASELRQGEKQDSPYRKRRLASPALSVRRVVSDRRRGPATLGHPAQAGRHLGCGGALRMSLARAVAAEEDAAGPLVRRSATRPAG